MMTPLQKIIKYCAITLAVALIVAIFRSIFSAVTGLNWLFGNKKTVLEDPTTQTLTGQISQLQIQVRAVKLEIRTGSEFAVQTNLENISVDQNDDRVEIREKGGRFFGPVSQAELTVILPEQTVLETASISTDAGAMIIKDLHIQRLDLELGAGDAHLERLCVTEEANISGGAGKITISGGSLANLEMEMGMGALKLKSTLTGRCRLDCGMGDTDLVLLGSREDYTLQLEKGIGSIFVDGKVYKKDATIGIGQNRIDIDAGVGNIQVTFEK